MCYQKYYEQLIKYALSPLCTFTPPSLCLHGDFFFPASLAPLNPNYTFLLSRLLLPGLSAEEPTQMEFMAFFLGFSQICIFPLLDYSGIMVGIHLPPLKAEKLFHSNS